MTFIDIPTEQTTAATDFILAIIAGITAFGIYNLGKKVKPLKTRIWVSVFILLTVAALFGAVAHGFKMSEQLNYILWQPLNLALGLSVSLFAAGAIFDLRYGNLPKGIIPGLLAIGVIFYFITVFIPGSFLVFIIYEALVMLFALIAYIFLAMQKKLVAAWWMVLGILITIIAAVIQAMGNIRIDIIWALDHNGLFHIVQMGGILIIYLGLAKSFQPKTNK
jgi:hypothetical protein